MVIPREKKWNRSFRFALTSGTVSSKLLLKRHPSRAATEGKMSKNYRIDLTTAKPADLAGYFRSALFSEWITSLDNESLWEAERAFQVALNKTADYRLARATVENYRISDAALSHTFGGGKTAGLRGV